MYTPAMQNLFTALLGKGHPLLGGTPMMPAQPTPLFPHPYAYGGDPQQAALQAPQNPYGETQVTNVPQYQTDAQFNTQHISTPEVPVQGSFMQHLQAYFQNNPQALQGLMGAMQGPQGGAETPMPSLGLVQSQPWNAQGHF